MAKSVFSHFTKDSGAGDKPRATCGGCTEAKPLPYSPPKGPTSQKQEGPGLHGSNHGSGGTQGRH